MKRFMIPLLALASLSVQGCDKTKKVFGMNRETPDEFKVLDRAPLSVPPGIGLKPPVPGAQRPQDKTPQAKAQELILNETPVGNSSSTGSASDDFLKESAQTQGKNPAIRQDLAKDAVRGKPQENKIQKALLGQEDKKKEDVIDPQKEYERLEGKAHPSASKTDEE